MGNFGGHALPGSFFIIFALFWTIQIYRRFFRSLANKSRKGESFRSSTTYPFDFLCGRAKYWEWEGILKILFTTVGGGIEIFTAFKDGKFNHLGNGQHATMFFFFFLSGVIDVTVHSHPTLLPQGVQNLAGTMAFSVEALLFAFHTHDRPSMDVMIHSLLLYSIILCALMPIIELVRPHSALAPLCRAYFVLLQGTWFWQAGFILYNPIPNAVPWDQEDHAQMMIVTMIFAWHMAVDFLLILALGLVMRLAQRCCARASAHHSLLGNGDLGYDQLKLTMTSSNGGSYYGEEDDERENKKADKNANNESDANEDDDETILTKADSVIEEYRDALI